MFVFFFNDTATTEIYTLSLHDALPIFAGRSGEGTWHPRPRPLPAATVRPRSHHRLPAAARRSEEHTSELQSRQYLVCRLLLEKKKSTLITISLGCSETGNVYLQHTSSF